MVVFHFGQAMAELYLPTLMSDVVNNGMMKGDTAYISRYGGYMLLVALASSLCAIMGSYVSSMVGTGFGRDIRDQVFSRIESYSLHEFDQIGTASLITRNTNDITQVQTLLVMGLRFVIYVPVIYTGALFMAYSKNPELTRLLVIVPFLMGAFVVGLANWIVPLFRIMQIKLDKVNLVLRENLTGIRVVRAFNRIDSETERFRRASRELADNAIRVNKILALMQPVMILAMNITTVAVIWFGGWRIARNTMQIGDMMAFMQYAMQVMFAIIMVTVVYFMVPRAQASAARINEVLDMEPEIKDPPEPKQWENCKGMVEFRDVTFFYPGAEAPALSGISFTAQPGQVTAIIGGTGSGKSTLINLILRFYDVTQGSVLVDDVDVREVAQKELRRRIGYVPQTPVLFSGTVADNIRYGKDDATDEEICHAAEVAQAAGFVEAMKNGYDSKVSQGGKNLSGGQKQRLSIARALVRKPSIYIFDDSFSALDFQTEARLRSALKQETSNATVIIVAQRVSTVMDADNIAVLDEGRLVGFGKHQELLNTCQVYREIVLSQLSEEEIA